MILKTDGSSLQSLAECGQRLSRRLIGRQPGRHGWRQLTAWRAALPDGYSAGARRKRSSDRLATGQRRDWVVRVFEILWRESVTRCVYLLQRCKLHESDSWPERVCPTVVNRKLLYSIGRQTEVFYDLASGSSQQLIGICRVSGKITVLCVRQKLQLMYDRSQRLSYSELVEVMYVGLW